MSVRVVRGEIDSKDVTTRVVIPTSAVPKWPPIRRVAEVIATPRRPFPPHRHEFEEVLTYVIEGSAMYAFGPGPAEPLLPGSTKLLTATTAVSHAINPSKGQTVRWYSLVTSLPPEGSPTARLQSLRAEPTEIQPDGTVLRHLVGPRSPIESSSGLESESIAFPQEGTTFRRVGHDRLAVIYALAGPGRVDTYDLDTGEAALVEDAAGVGLKGEPGFHVIFSSVPRPAVG
jgi:redox-sensitive bicupin YhaK (pirin superfamily)